MFTLGISDRDKVEEVVTEAGKEIFRMGPAIGGNHEVPCRENPFDYGKGPFHKRTGTADSPVPPFVFLGEFPSPYCPVHGFVDGGERNGTEIPFVPVYRLTFLREIDLAVVH